jgi:60kDa lysophospholipase
LSQFIRLSLPASQTPKIVVSRDSLDEATQDAAAPWSWTATEAASTEAVLLPFLTHLAAARDDVEGMGFCLSAAASNDSVTTPSVEIHQYGFIAGGIVNCLESASGRSPLHVAALNGSIQCTNILLRSGALVHLRDSLGHTALYYVSHSDLGGLSYRIDRYYPRLQAARQGHEKIVDALVQAGANLGGIDFEGGFVALAVKLALRAGDQNSLRIWSKAGVQFPDHDGRSELIERQVK